MKKIVGRSTVYNANLTNDWEKVRKENQKLVQDFIKYSKSCDRSPMTLKQYQEWLKVFFCWNYKENEDKFFIDLKKRDFVYYFGWCRDLGMSANRIASLKSVLSSLSSEIELLYEDEYPNFHNQLRGLEPIKISTVRPKTIISDEEMIKILQTLIDLKEYQTACYLALACASGSRKAELLQMKVSFFTQDAEVLKGYMYCTPEIRTKGSGKKGKMIKKYVIKEIFKPFLDLWIAEREKLGIKLDDLFVTKRDGEYVKATVSTANSFAAKISKIFNIEYYTHSSRHFFCTYLKNLDLPNDVIVQIVGWSENSGDSMVAIYDDTDKNLKIEKYFMDFLSKKMENDKGE
ncbi:MAG: site-specific integrase [Methanobrevibacter sp.]|nr:site-specific integrase [Methanobrevibacter sp.]